MLHSRRRATSRSARSSQRTCPFRVQSCPEQDYRARLQPRRGTFSVRPGRQAYRTGDVVGEPLPMFLGMVCVLVNRCRVCFLCFPDAAALRLYFTFPCAVQVAIKRYLFPYVAFLPICFVNSCVLLNRTSHYYFPISCYLVIMFS
jgi:hypothetical protein